MDYLVAYMALRHRILREIKKNSPILLIAIFFLFIRLYLTLTHDNYLGVDGGAYLLSALSKMGYTAEQGFPRPPLAPGYLLTPFIYFFGLDIGYKIWSSVFSIPPIFATYCLSRIWLHRKHALWVALFVGVDMSFSEMLVTGSLPLFSLSLLIVVITVVIKNHNLRMSNWKAGSIIIFCIPLICITNQTSFAIMLYALPVLLSALIIIKSPRILNIIPQIIKLAPVMMCMIIGLLISVFFLEYYFNPELDALIYPGPMLYLSPIWDSVYWFNIPIGLTVAIMTYKKTKSRSLKSLAVLLLIVTIITPIVSYNESVMNIPYRSRYFQFFLIYPLLGYLLFSHLWPAIHRLTYSNTFTLFFYPFIRKIKYLVLVSILLLASYEFVKTFDGQARYSDQITPAVLAALDISGDRVIASNFSQAHWISAILKPEPIRRISHRWSLPPSKEHYEEYKAVNCLYGLITECNLKQAQKYLDVDWILINENDTLSDPGLKTKLDALNTKKWLKSTFSENDIVLYQITP